MTTMNGRSIPVGPQVPAALHSGVASGARVRAIRGSERLVWTAPLLLSALAAAVGGAALFVDGADAYAVPALALLGLSLLVAAGFARARSAPWEWSAIVLACLCFLAVGALLAMPEWMYGANVNGIVHRSVFSSPALLVLSVFAGSRALRAFLGATPTAEDLSLYPILALPVALALVGYGLVLGRVVVSGLGQLNFGLLTNAWREDLVQQGGNAQFAYQLGFLNNILGTLLLVTLTCLFAVLPGIGAGVFMSEYPGKIAKVIEFCTAMLRAVSVVVIGAAAFGLVRFVSDQPAGTLVSDMIRGTYEDQGGLHPGSGSFLTASVFLSLLVMPVIAKLTEEGLRSVPREIREGSVALGATDGHGLLRILLPWAGPNILTGLLLGAAEASGSLAVIMFIAGTGQSGVGLTNVVTTLDYAVFATQYGPRTYFERMRDYQSTAALLLLLLTVGLTVVALWVRQRSARRARGTLTGG